MINQECNDTDQAQSSLGPKRGVMNPMNIFYKFFVIWHILTSFIFPVAFQNTRLCRG